jgi:hypothetical protein
LPLEPLPVVPLPVEPLPVEPVEPLPFAPEPVVPEPVLPEPVVPEPVLPEPVLVALSESVVPEAVELVPVVPLFLFCMSLPVGELESVELMLSALFALLGSAAGRSLPHATPAKPRNEANKTTCSRTMFNFS